MSHHDDPLRPHEVCAAHGLGTQPFTQLEEGGHECGNVILVLGRRYGFEDHRLDGTSRSLRCLEQHVPGESVGDDDIGLLGGQIPPLDVPDELDGVRVRQQAVRLALEITSLRRLFADVEEPDLRSLDVAVDL